jgi:hypothetical protein
MVGEGGKGGLQTSTSTVTAAATIVTPSTSTQLYGPFPEDAYAPAGYHWNPSLQTYMPNTVTGPGITFPVQNLPPPISQNPQTGLLEPNPITVSPTQIAADTTGQIAAVLSTQLQDIANQQNALNAMSADSTATLNKLDAQAQAKTAAALVAYSNALKSASQMSAQLMYNQQLQQALAAAAATQAQNAAAASAGTAAANAQAAANAALMKQQDAAAAAMQAALLQSNLSAVAAAQASNAAYAAAYSAAGQAQGAANIALANQQYATEQAAAVATQQASAAAFNAQAAIDQAAAAKQAALNAAATAMYGASGVPITIEITGPGSIIVAPGPITGVLPTQTASGYAGNQPSISVVGSEILVYSIGTLITVEAVENPGAAFIGFIQPVQSTNPVIQVSVVSGLVINAVFSSQKAVTGILHLQNSDGSPFPTSFVYRAEIGPFMLPTITFPKSTNISPIAMDNNGNFIFTVSPGTYDVDLAIGYGQHIGTYAKHYNLVLNVTSGGQVFNFLVTDYNNVSAKTGTIAPDFVVTAASISSAQNLIGGLQQATGAITVQGAAQPSSSATGIQSGVGVTTVAQGTVSTTTAGATTVGTPVVASSSSMLIIIGGVIVLIVVAIMVSKK